MNNQAATAERLKEQETMRLMDQDQRERTTAKMSYDYLRQAYFKDLKLHSKEPLEVMAKRPNWPLFAKTYTTSKDTQLRDMTLNVSICVGEKCKGWWGIFSSYFVCRFFFIKA